MEHPLEKLFGLEPMSTQMVVQSSEIETVETPLFDEKDKEIEGELQEVYRLALDGYDSMVGDLDNIEPKYRCRGNEVALQYLNTALQASRQKMDLKRHRDLLTSKVLKGGFQSSVTNNVLVADRNELLKFMRDQSQTIGPDSE